MHSSNTFITRLGLYITINHVVWVWRLWRDNVVNRYSRCLLLYASSCCSECLYEIRPCLGTKICPAVLKSLASSTCWQWSVQLNKRWLQRWHPKMPVCLRHRVASLQRRPAHWYVAYSWNKRRHPHHHHSLGGNCVQNWHVKDYAHISTSVTTWLRAK